MDSTKFNKLLNEKYFLFKDIAKENNYNEELLDMITFIYLSFYMDFGKECDFPLYDIFNKVKIIYDQDSVNAIAIKNNFGKISSRDVAITIFSPNLKVFENPDLKQKPQTILLGAYVENRLATPVLKLEMLLHEIRHVLMGYYNTNILLDENTYYIRSGLHEIYYLKNANNNENFSTKSMGNTIDEITNSYITELLVNKIMSFKKYKIENNNLNQYLYSIKTSQPDGKYRAVGYNSEVKLLYPLLLNETFIDIINQHQFDGNIDLIKKFIEKNSNLIDYEQFSTLLDTVYNNNIKYPTEVENNNVDFIHEHISSINRVKTIVLDINSCIAKNR